MKTQILAKWIILVISFFLGATASCLATPPERKPLIGIILNEEGSGGYSIYPWYAIRKNYGERLVELGAIPIYLGLYPAETDDYLSILDGLLLTGGNFTSPDEVYTTGIRAKVDPKKYPRTALEIELVKKAFDKDMPVLAICAGMQDMTAALGGTLIRHIANEVQTDINHYQEDREKKQHKIRIRKNTKLHKILKAETLAVNSNHQEGVKTLPLGLIESANAEDGVIEGIEAPNKRFFIGVMWHPEFLLNPQEKELFKAFVKSAIEYQGS